MTHQPDPDRSVEDRILDALARGPMTGPEVGRHLGHDSFPVPARERDEALVRLVAAGKLTARYELYGYRQRPRRTYRIADGGKNGGPTP